jgi:hypothetical protein
MVLSTIDENLALFNNGSNGDSVPATVPEREPRLYLPGLGHEPKVAAIALREHMLPA